MRCNLSRNELQQFLAGQLKGSASARVRNHLAECASCAAGLSVLDRTELLPAMDEVVEPSENLGANFHDRLLAHRSRQGPQRPDSWWQRLLPVGLPGRVAIAGSVAALLIAGIVLRIQQPAAPIVAGDEAIAENLPLYQDMGVIRNLDLLEDFDDIDGMAEHETGAK